MGLEETDQVDFVVSRRDGSVALVLIDAEPWGDGAHLLRLRDKLNTYVAYIETGQVRELETVEESTAVAIEVVARYEPDDEALRFLFGAGEVLAKAGITLTWRTGP